MNNYRTPNAGMGFQGGDPWAGAEAFDFGTTRLPRVGEGGHVLRLSRVTTPKMGDLALILEFDVIQSTNVSHTPGTQRSVYIASKFRDSLMRQINAALAAIYGYDPRDDAARAAYLPHATDVIRAALGAGNLLEGRTVGCEGVAGNKVDPKTGDRYCNYVWSALEAPGVLPPPGFTPAPPAAPPGWAQLPNGQWVQR